MLVNTARTHFPLFSNFFVKSEIGFLQVLIKGFFPEPSDGGSLTPFPVDSFDVEAGASLLPGTFALCFLFVNSMGFDVEMEGVAGFSASFCVVATVCAAGVTTILVAEAVSALSVNKEPILDGVGGLVGAVDSGMWMEGCGEGDGEREV